MLSVLKSSSSPVAAAGDGLESDRVELHIPQHVLSADPLGAAAGEDGDLAPGQGGGFGELGQIRDVPDRRSRVEVGEEGLIQPANVMFLY